MAEYIKIKPMDREKYPHYKSKTELQKLGLQPSDEKKPAALVARHGYNDYFLYDENLAVPYVLSNEERARRNELRRLLRRKYTCSGCKMYLGKRNGEYEFERYGGFCKECFDAKKDVYDHNVKKALASPIIEYDPVDSVVLDLETTGLSPLYDEILQITILNLNGDVLLNTKVKPQFHIAWPEAYAVNKIKWDDLQDCPCIHELIPTIKGIFSKVSLVVGFNVSFDMKFLSELGIPMDNISKSDVMEDFAPYYGEPYRLGESFAWKSLSFCAEYFSYDFKPHDSLEDCKATLFCYNKLMELKQSGAYSNKVNANYDMLYSDSESEE